MRSERKAKSFPFPANESQATSLVDELARFCFWLAARLEKKHEDAVVRYYTQPWAHMGKSAVTTRTEDRA